MRLVDGAVVRGRSRRYLVTCAWAALLGGCFIQYGDPVGPPPAWIWNHSSGDFILRLWSESPGQSMWLSVLAGWSGQVNDWDREAVGGGWDVFSASCAPIGGLGWAGRSPGLEITADGLSAPPDEPQSEGFNWAAFAVSAYPCPATGLPLPSLGASRVPLATFEPRMTFPSPEPNPSIPPTPFSRGPASQGLVAAG